MKADVLPFALSYAEHGFPVIPLHSYDRGSCTCRKACGSPAKHPRTEHGLTDASTDTAAIRHWWAKWPAANVGLVVPEGYVVLDIDQDSASDAVGGRDLPVTATSKTGRGWHYLYRTTRPIRPRAGALPHVDLRGPGSYIVAPPSVHSTGSEYAWVNPPRDGIADAPGWLYELDAERPRTNGHASPGEPIPAGQRNAALTSMAGTMRRRGFSEEAILAALQVENASRCFPPLDDAEVRRIAASVARYAPEADVQIDVDPTSEPSYRTLADIDDSPPAPLLLGMLEHGPTMEYAGPGVGKGMTGAWTVCELQKLGMRPAIYDAERRPREWARRVSGLGGDRSRTVYIEPSDLPVAMAGRPLWEAIEAIREIVQVAGVDVLIVDSVLPATGVAEDRLRSDPAVPFLYVAALDSLGIPSLSFGHPPKGQPEGDPFGSMAWVAAMRLTWNGTPAEGDRHRVRWRPRKRNERGHLAGVLLTFEYGDDGLPRAVTREDDEESTRDWLLVALVHGPRSVADLAEEQLEDSEGPETRAARDRIKERLNKALRRMARDGLVVKHGKTGSKVQWSLPIEVHAR